MRRSLISRCCSQADSHRRCSPIRSTARRDGSRTRCRLPLGRGQRVGRESRRSRAFRIQRRLLDEDRQARQQLRAIFERAAGHTRESIALLDVSTNVDQFGVAWGLQLRSRGGRARRAAPDQGPRRRQSRAEHQAVPVAAVSVGTGAQRPESGDPFLFSRSAGVWRRRECNALRLEHGAARADSAGSHSRKPRRRIQRSQTSSAGGRALYAPLRHRGGRTVDREATTATRTDGRPSI